MFFTFVGKSYSQNNNRFQYLDDDLGPMSTSIHMMQDSYGFIWSSTLSGLTKYDGNAYHHYVKSDSIDGLPAVFAYCSFEDKYHNIWVALYDYGLVILNRDSDSFQWIKSDTLTPNGLHLSKIKTIASDSNDNIYFLGEDGIQRVALQQKSYDHLRFQSQSEFLPNLNEKITGLSLLNDRRGRFWIGSRKGVYILDNTGEVKKQESFQGANSITHSILEDSSGDIYIVRGGEPLLRFDVKKQTFEKDTTVVFPNQYMLSVIDHEDHLWTFIRPGKVFKYDLKNKQLDKFSSYELPYNISGTYFRSPLVSKDGTIWLAGGGSFPFQHQPKTNKEIHPIIYDETRMHSSSCVYVDETHIYVGLLLDGGIKIINKSTGKTRSLTKDNSAMHDDRIYQILEIDKDRLVIMGRGGVYVYDKIIQSITKTKRFTRIIRWGYYAGDDIMWVGGEMKRIEKLDLKDMSTSSIFDSNDELPEVNVVTQIVEDTDGSIWIGGRYHGLYHYFPQSGKCEVYSRDADDPRYQLSTSIIEAIHIDQKGDVWIGGRSGIDVIDQVAQSISSIGITDGLKHVHICDITQDDSLNYWIATEQDISRIDNRTKKITTFDNEDGFINRRYYYRSFAKFNGHLFVAGESGVDKFNPNNFGINLVPPQIALANISVMGKKYVSDIAIEKLDKIVIDHNQNFIDFDVLSLHYIAPEKNEIAYKFEDVHEDYINIGSRRNISFSGLSPGTHNLWIKGSNSDDVWSEPKSIIIDVAYPWWRTWTFYIGAFLFIGMTVWFALKTYMASISKKQKEKEKISTQMAELELKALSSQMNPHFLFNSLNSIKSLINQNKNAEAGTFIIRYSRLIRQILNNSRSKFVRLQEEVDVISLYLELEKLRMGESFTFDIDMDDDVEADFIEIPPALIQPYVENSIWHGLLNKEHGNKHLSIKICKVEDFLEIRIIDNGIGRQASKAIQSQSLLKNKSLGTTISKERINLITDVYGHKSTVNFIDLHDKDGQPSGTEVQILLYFER